MKVEPIAKMVKLFHIWFLVIELCVFLVELLPIGTSPDQQSRSLSDSEIYDSDNRPYIRWHSGAISIDVAHRYSQMMAEKRGLQPINGYGI